MIRIALLATLLVVACATAPQEAEGEAVTDVYGPERGERIAGISGNFSDHRIDAEENGLPTVYETLFELNGRLSYFFTASSEAGLSAEVGLIDSSFPDTDSKRYELWLFYNYNWRWKPHVWLYAGPDLGFTYTKDDFFGGDWASDPRYGIRAGSRFWITPRTSLFLEPYYEIESAELAAGDADVRRVGVRYGLEVAF